jgi:hypothetical protein
MTDEPWAAPGLSLEERARITAEHYPYNDLVAATAMITAAMRAVELDMLLRSARYLGSDGRPMPETKPCRLADDWVRAKIGKTVTNYRHEGDEPHRSEGMMPSAFEGRVRRRDP